MRQMLDRPQRQVNRIRKRAYNGLKRKAVLLPPASKIHDSSLLLKSDQHFDHSCACRKRLQGLADHGAHEPASVRVFHGISWTRGSNQQIAASDGPIPSGNFAGRDPELDIAQVLVFRRYFSVATSCAFCASLITC
jgi:hypothetical protein